MVAGFEAMHSAVRGAFDDVMTTDDAERRFTS